MTDSDEAQRLAFDVLDRLGRQFWDRRVQELRPYKTSDGTLLLFSDDDRSPLWFARGEDGEPVAVRTDDEGNTEFGAIHTGRIQWAQALVHTMSRN